MYTNRGNEVEHTIEIDAQGKVRLAPHANSHERILRLLLQYFPNPVPEDILKAQFPKGWDSGRQAITSLRKDLRCEPCCQPFKSGPGKVRTCEHVLRYSAQEYRFEPTWPMVRDLAGDALREQARLLFPPDPWVKAEGGEDPLEKLSPQHRAILLAMVEGLPGFTQRLVAHWVRTNLDMDALLLWCQQRTPKPEIPHLTRWEGGLATDRIVRVMGEAGTGKSNYIREMVGKLTVADGLLPILFDDLFQGPGRPIRMEVRALEKPWFRVDIPLLHRLVEMMDWSLVLVMDDFAAYASPRAEESIRTLTTALTDLLVTYPRIRLIIGSRASYGSSSEMRTVMRRARDQYGVRTIRLGPLSPPELEKLNKLMADSCHVAVNDRFTNQVASSPILHAKLWLEMQYRGEKSGGELEEVIRRYSDLRLSVIPTLEGREAMEERLRDLAVAAFDGQGRRHVPEDHPAAEAIVRLGVHQLPYLCTVEAPNGGWKVGFTHAEFLDYWLARSVIHGLNEGKYTLLEGPILARLVSRFVRLKFTTTHAAALLKVLPRQNDRANALEMNATNFLSVLVLTNKVPPTSELGKELMIRAKERSRALAEHLRAPPSSLEESDANALAAAREWAVIADKLQSMGSDATPENAHLAVGQFTDLVKAHPVLQERLANMVVTYFGGDRFKAIKQIWGHFKNPSTYGCSAPIDIYQLIWVFRCQQMTWADNLLPRPDELPGGRSAALRSAMVEYRTFYEDHGGTDVPDAT